ncbi:hypothetical protein HK103_003671 [Boothiomyces macroporosus]|uniref:Alpha/beta hydrolase fold-3 domain-containing protein n=1 Tax=Boothiomyces macroporosus TaxID=261099 RepID=A0AAD5ULX4_9FUNG|nr:hypothetical protein HK103_003671 [Boothiomyces macroporosus]
MLEFITTVYKQYEHLKCKKIMMGDSAGGNLVLTSCIYMSKLGFKVPSTLVCISPWVDLSSDYADVETDVLHSEILESFQSNYCTLSDTENKLVSPLLIKDNEMDCFVGKNIMLTSGGKEVLEPQIKEMADKLSKITNVVYDCDPEMPHIYQCLPEGFGKNSTSGTERMMQFIVEHVK